MPSFLCSFIRLFSSVYIHVPILHIIGHRWLRSFLLLCEVLCVGVSFQTKRERSNGSSSCKWCGTARCTVTARVSGLYAEQDWQQLYIISIIQFVMVQFLRHHYACVNLTLSLPLFLLLLFFGCVHKVSDIWFMPFCLMDSKLNRLCERHDQHAMVPSQKFTNVAKTKYADSESRPLICSMMRTLVIEPLNSKSSKQASVGVLNDSVTVVYCFDHAMSHCTGNNSSYTGYSSSKPCTYQLQRFATRLFRSCYYATTGNRSHLCQDQLGVRLCKKYTEHNQKQLIIVYFEDDSPTQLTSLVYVEYVQCMCCRL